MALVTDGRMSGASGKVPAAIQVTPEALVGGTIGRVRDGDVVRLGAEAGLLEVRVDAAELAARPSIGGAAGTPAGVHGRELFAMFRRSVGTVESGASPLQ